MLCWSNQRLTQHLSTCMPRRFFFLAILKHTVFLPLHSLRRFQQNNEGQIQFIWPIVFGDGMLCTAHSVYVDHLRNMQRLPWKPLWAYHEKSRLIIFCVQKKCHSRVEKRLRGYFWCYFHNSFISVWLHLSCSLHQLLLLSFNQAHALAITCTYCTKSYIIYRMISYDDPFFFF